MSKPHVPSEREKEAMLAFTKAALKDPGFFSLPQEEQWKIAKRYMNQSKVVPIEDMKEGGAGN